MFGGAFDPPHCAHRALAETALQQLALDVLHVLPTGQAWHKSRVLSTAAHRLAMCQAAFGDLTRVHIDPREMEREGPSYTADTLSELADQYPGARLFLVLGADQLMTFRNWSRWEEVLRYATLAVANRPLHLAADAVASEGVEVDLNSVGIPFQRLHMPLHPTSSTAIRAHLHGQSHSNLPFDLDVLVPDGVARYISDHHLYETPT